MLQKRKLRKTAVLLSLSLGLTVPVWATPVKEEISLSADQSSKTGQNASAMVKGLIGQGEHSDETSYEITVEALAGTNSSGNVSAYAYGIWNTSSTLTTENNIIVATTTGGKAENGGSSSAYAYGIENQDKLKTGDNIIMATAVGGKVTSASSSSDATVKATVYGILNKGNLTGENTTIVVAATGGEAENGGNNDATVYGIQNEGSLTSKDNTITATAKGGKSTSSSVYAHVYGILNKGTLTTADTTIVATTVGGEAGNTGSSFARAYGIENDGILTSGSNTITITVTGGTTTSSATETLSYGILNKDTMTTEDNTIVVTTIGGGAGNAGNSSTYAYGIGNAVALTTADNTIVVTTIGGEAGNAGNSSTYTYGIENAADMTIGANTITVTATGGKATYSSTDVYAGGIKNGYQSASTEDNTIEVTAIGGEAENGKSSNATVYGIRNNGSLTTGNNTIIATATGGKASSSSSVAYGILSERDSNALITKDNTIVVTATGGEVENGGNGNATVYGILNYNNYGVVTTGNNTITVTATGGKATSYGISNDNNHAILNTGDNTITAIAIEDRGTGGATAYGIFHNFWGISSMSTKNNTIDVKAVGKSGFASAVGIYNNGTMDTKENIITAIATGGASYSTAIGVHNHGTLSTDNNTIEVTAIGGEAENDGGGNNAIAYGINNSGTMDTKENIITAIVTGGTLFHSNARDRTIAYGIQNNGGTLTTENNVIVATATGGEVSSINSVSDYSELYIEAYGIQNNYGIVTTGANTIVAMAAGGEIMPTNQSSDSLVSTTAYGIHSSGIMDTKENIIRAIATGGIAEGAAATSKATAIGMFSDFTGSLTAVGSQNIYTEAVAGTANGISAEAHAYALLAHYGGAIILDSQGEAVQLTGDIGVNQSGMIVVTLDNTDSYWRPRFQDTYSPYNDGDGAVNGSFGGGSFTIQNGGVLDLAWHSNLGGYNFKDSQLDLTGDTIRIGDGATFIVNADLANDVADTISADTTATGTQYVQVAYDPSYLTYESVEGRALVLNFDGANGQGVASTVETPIRNVTFMPTMEGGYLVNLTSLSKASEQGKTASDSYQHQINVLRTQWSTLIQRLGDVRNESSEFRTGAWARTYGGKLKSDGAYGRKSTMKYGGIQAGYDRMREMSSGKYLTGFLVDYVDADSDFQRGNGEIKALSFGGYWTWLNPKGHYADVVVKATHLDTNYDFSYMSGEKASTDFTNWGYTMSLEYGYRHDLKKNSYLEPQAQFLIGHLHSKTYRTSNGVNLHQEGSNLALGRLGVLYGYEFGKDEKKSSTYLRGSIVHDFSGSGALTSSYEGDRITIDTAGSSGTSFEVNVGANMVFSKHNYLYAELTKSFGGDVKTDWQANVGWRMKW